MSNAHDLPRQQQPVLKLMLIEDDPIFRLGLVAFLEPLLDLHVLLEADSRARALQLLRELPADEATDTNAAIVPARSLALIILNLDLGQATAGQGVGLSLCQQLSVEYPQFPILLLGSTLELTRLAVAFQAGAGGYCLKGTSAAELVTAIRQVASGQPYWTEGIQAIAQSLNAAQLSTATTTATDRLLETRPHVAASRSLLAVWRRNLRLSGVRQVERAIAELDAQAEAEQSLINQWVVAGQRRELWAARWLVKRLLTPSSELANESASDQLSQAPWQETPLANRQPLPDSARLPQQTDTDLHAEPSPTPASLDPTAASQIQLPQTALFQATFTKLQGNLHNYTTTVLEIDILKPTKKRELLYTVLQKLQEVLDSLRFSQVPIDQLEMKGRVILQDLWQATVTVFFGKYYTLEIGNQSVDVVDYLLQDQLLVQTEILAKIPLFSEFLAHLLFQTPLTIDDALYEAGTVEAMARMELLLQNLTIQVANAVMQPLLNRFGDIVPIKQSFYDKRLLSSREIERFRNDLSWKYRTERLIGEPTAIFESQFKLLVLAGDGIRHVSIYAPRNAELAELSGIPFILTLILETRDAIAPRLRTAFSFLGSGVVYILTEIIGRGIGLIGRGMIKGIGNALQDPKTGRNRERWR